MKRKKERQLKEIKIQKEQQSKIKKNERKITRQENNSQIIEKEMKEI